MIFGMTIPEALTLLGALGTFVTVVATQWIAIKRAGVTQQAVQDNTALTIATAATVEANTADRAVKTAETLAVLAPIAVQVNDLHNGTGNGGPPPERVVAPTG